MSPSHYNTPPSHPPPNETLSALLASQQMNGHPPPMDARQQEYQQPGLTKFYASSHDAPSKKSPVDSAAAAAQYQQDVKFGQDVRGSNFSPSSSTSNSDYALAPQSARSGTFPEYLQQQQQQPQQQQQQPRPYQDGAQRYQQQQPQPHPGHAAMAQASPSMSLSDDSPIGNASRENYSNPQLAIDPSIAATSSPQYAPQHQQYSPYAPQHEMHGYPPQPGAPMYAPRPEWAGHYAGPMYHAQVSAPGGAPGMIAQVPRPPGVCSPGDASSSL